MKTLNVRLIGLFLLVIACDASAQDVSPISTERPGFSSSPATLLPATWQLEIGYQYSRDDNGVDVDGHTLPLMLLRVGLIERLEFQLNWAGFSWVDSNGSSSNGANDASIGFKWQVTDSRSRIPIGIFAGLSLPVGANDFSSNEADPALGLFWTYSAALDFFGTAFISDSDDDTMISNAVGASFPLAEGRGVYAEYLATFGENNGSQHSLNGGMTFLLNNDLQIDVNGGLGLNDRSTDFFLGLGAAYRF